MAAMPPIKTPSCLNSSNYFQIPFSLPKQTWDIIAKYWYLALSETDTYILTNGNLKINKPQFQKISSSTRRKVHPFFIFMILSQIPQYSIVKIQFSVYSIRIREAISYALPNLFKINYVDISFNLPNAKQMQMSKWWNTGRIFPQLLLSRTFWLM